MDFKCVRVQATRAAGLAQRAALKPTRVHQISSDLHPGQLYQSCPGSQPIIKYKYYDVAALPCTCVAFPMISLTSLTSRRTSCWSAFVTIPRCHLSLAYTLHEPLQCLQGSKEGKPLIILHGLFGSKQNHRSISKYDHGTPSSFTSRYLTAQSVSTRSSTASLCTSTTLFGCFRHP